MQRTNASLWQCFSQGEVKLSSSGHNLFLNYCFHFDIARIFLIPRMKYPEVYEVYLKILS